MSCHLRHQPNDINPVRQLATLRPSSPYLELEEEHENGVSFFDGLIEDSHTGGQPNSRFEVLSWALDRCRSELKEEALRWILAGAFEDAVKFENLSILSLKSMSTVLDIDNKFCRRNGRFFNSMCYHSLFSSVIRRIQVPGITGGSQARSPRVGSQISIGAAYHEVAGIQSPTTIAMRQSATFFGWRLVLLYKGYNLQNFVTRELQEPPLVSQGWTQDTPLALFRRLRTLSGNSLEICFLSTM